MKITVVGSGSSGNSYIIDDGDSVLLIECGVAPKKTKQALNYDLSRVVGCLLSHSHGDHSKYAKEIMKMGIDLYCSPQTAEECGLSGHRLKGLSGMVETTPGTYTVLPFELHHDVRTFGFFIRSETACENLLFMTDSAYTEYTFPNLNYIMIETSYSEEMIKGEPDAPRLRRSHMSIENAVKMLEANDLSKVKEIWLLHLSNRFGNSEAFKKNIQAVTGCPVYIA